jgi:hypothetical protein
MKIDSRKETPPPPPFVPVTVMFTFETQQELDAMGKLFNYSLFCRQFRELAGTKGIFYGAFQQVGANVSNYNGIWREAITKMCTRTHTEEDK